MAQSADPTTISALIDVCVRMKKSAHREEKAPQEAGSDLRVEGGKEARSFDLRLEGHTNESWDMDDV